MILINLEKPKQDAGLNCTNKRIQFVAILLLQKKKRFLTSAYVCHQKISK